MVDLSNSDGEVLANWFEDSLRLRLPEDPMTRDATVAALDELHDGMRAGDVHRLTTGEAEPTEHCQRPGVQWVAGALQNSTYTANQKSHPCGDGVDIARMPSYPELGPFLALTWRSLGLAASKLNDYVVANGSFEEARQRLDEWSRNKRFVAVSADPRSQLVAMHREAREQVALGATGTAARVVEFLLQNWCVTFRKVDLAQQRLAWIRAYRALRQGIGEGETAADAAEVLIMERPTRIERFRDLGRCEGYEGLQDHLDVIVQGAWIRRPAVMTARCHILAVPLCLILDKEGAVHPVHRDWTTAIAEHVSKFVHYYELATTTPAQPVPKEKPDTDFQREIAQLRFAFGLLFPDVRVDGDARARGGRDYEPQIAEIRGRVGLVDSEANRIAHRYLHSDIAFVDELSAPLPSVPALADWLEARQWDANIILSITSDEYISQMRRLNMQRDSVEFIREHPVLVRKDARRAVVGWKPELRSAFVGRGLLPDD